MSDEDNEHDFSSALFKAVRTAAAMSKEMQVADRNTLLERSEKAEAERDALLEENAALHMISGADYDRAKKAEAVLADIERQKEIARQWQAKMPMSNAIEPVVVFNKFVRAIDRLEMLRNLPENHDSVGAAAPDQDSAETAKLLLMALASGTIRPTLGRDGNAVIEIEDWATGLYAEIALTSECEGEIFVRMKEPPRQPVL